MAPETPWPICKICRSIPYSVFGSNSQETIAPVRLFDSFTALVNSADRGCHVCTLLYEAIHEPYKTQLETAVISLESKAATDSGPRNIQMMVSLDTPDLAGGQELALLRPSSSNSSLEAVAIGSVKFVLDYDLVPRTAKNYRNLISLYADDDGALRYIKQNLNDCLAQHKNCDRVMFPLSSATEQRGRITNIVSGSRGMVVAPTRLISVGSEDDPKDVPKLVDGKECLYKGGYLTLSYCWGNVPVQAPWLLTTKTMPKFAAGLPMEILPQTLHDAITWTRKLGERYIWIDSMCIIQDDPEDWQREAARMASIYGSATLTLVAASSNIYGGLSGRIDPWRNSAAALPTISRTTTKVVYILPNGQKRQSTALPPTGSRGWCYQENLLSSRLVQIYRTSLQWQCLGDKSNPPTRAQGLEQLSKHPPAKYYTIWYRLIERYSGLSLTYPKDKLLAFHGIAMDKAGRNYVAGLLQNDPWASLLWCRDENQIRQKSGGRNLRKDILEPTSYDPEFHSASAKAASYFETGAITDGHVEISAQSVFVRSAPTKPFLFNTRQGSHTYGRRNIVEATTGAILGMIVFDIAGEARDGMAMCCVLLHVVNIGLWEKNSTAGLGLALRIEFREGKVVYKRVGYAQFTSTFAHHCRSREFNIV
ncbi:hypothetical protein LTR78_010870 [Recurvomyces mirabilis]|uniref:Heterokaryon incompatibility domain-containing protein n=1 Tax=Recurvomyces mirabilis TaxID=574656 RepID=A0AAE0WI21_9PEZI|nr:hypothetical protein LTR78_010870 [Recurvomyces mirabilis]KAK5162362.1 hypothetical protein LTS14_000709 [Recurvomyces mirabilis]